MTSIFRIIAIVTSCLFALCPETSAGETRQATAGIKALTLADALSRAFESNPEMKASELEIEAASARQLQAGFRPNPELSAEIQNLPALRSGDIFRTTEADILISQRLETGGKRALRLKNARMEKTLASHDLERTRAELVAGTKQAFAEVLANQERVSNCLEIAALAEQAHAIVRERVAAGKASPVEETVSVVALTEARLEVKKQTEELIASKDRLAAMWGGTAADFERATEEFAIPAIPADLSACLESGPDLLLAGTAVESRRAALELERAMRIPDVTLTGGFRRSNSEDFNAWVAGVSIPLPFFDKREGAIAEARVRLEKASYDRKSLERILRARLAEERHKYEIARLEATSLAANSLPAAAQAVEATEEGYRLGKLQHLSVLDAQRTHAELHRKHIEAVASGMKAAIEMDRLAGCRSPQSLPKEAQDEK